MRKRVVILGAGFGGLSAAKELAGRDLDVCVIDRRNYHLFQPLLYQVATAGLSPADIAYPVRAILAPHRNIAVLLGRVSDIDAERRVVHAGGRAVPYDYLIVATGARHAYFGHDDWETVAPGLKKIDDATEIRRRVLLAFEQAESEPDEARRQRLLTFVVIGGGPTGVEMAGAIAELAHKALAEDFRTIDPTAARIMLIEAGPRLLPAFAPQLSDAARRSLQRLGVEVRLGEAVRQCDADGVMLGAARIASATLVWAAGVAASPAGKWLKTPVDRAGRVIVTPELSIPGHREIFVIGDTAAVSDAAGAPVPGIAPAAKQMGRHAARAILHDLAGRSPARFRYRHLGSLATIGRGSAVCQFGRLRLSGFLAWLLWGAIHVYFLIGFRNRLAVVTDWIWAYATFGRGARLITGPTDAPR